VDTCLVERKGRLTMREEEWQMVGWSPKGKAPDFGEFFGKVGKTLPNGCGFMECQEVKDQHEQDAYIHSSVMEQCSLRSGDEIWFNVHVNSSGRPQVSAPCWKRRARAAPRSFTQRAYPQEDWRNSGKGEKDGWERDSSWSQSSAGYDSKAPSWGKGSKGGGGSKGSGDSWKGDGGWGGDRGGDRGKGKGKSWSAASSSKGYEPPRDEYPSFQKGGGSPAGEGEVFIGHIKMADAAKGFSLIACPATGFDADTYIHHMTAPPQAFAVDDVVAFKLHVSGKGRPQADSVYKMVGFTRKEPSFGKYFGILRQLLNTGNGFIECLEIKEEFGKDAFIHQTVVEQCGLTSGDNIAFDVHISSSGSPQVSAPCWVLVGDNGGFGQDAAAPMQKGAAPSPMQKGSVFKSDPWSSRSDTWSSRSDAWNSKSDGWSSASNGSSSVFKTKGGTMRVEAGEKGKGGKGAPAGHWAPQETYSHGKSKGKGWASEQEKSRADAWGAKAKTVQLDDIVVEYMPDDFLAGRVLLIDTTKNVSLVKCPDSGYDKDIYTHASVAEPGALAVNDVVCFKLHVNAKGMPQASAPFWKRIGDDPPDPIRYGEFQGLVGVSDDGTLRVDSPEVTETHGQDALLSEDLVVACNLVEGNLIRFNVNVNDVGTPEVIGPCWICCSDESRVREVLPGTKRARPDSSEGGYDDGEEPAQKMTKFA